MFLKKIARLMQPILTLYITPVAILNAQSLKMQKAVLRPVIRYLSRMSKVSYLKYVEYPKNIKDVKFFQCNEEVKDIEKIAIIFQGPIEYENNFTLDTIKLYRFFFGSCGLILSTWKGSVTEALRNELRKLEVYIVESEEPDNPGRGNVNMQLKSSYAGAVAAEKLGYKYSFKHRADIRFYNGDFLCYLKGLLDLFPVNDSLAESRLIYLNYNSYRKLPFYLRDFCVFGATSEIKKLYGIKHDTKEKNYLNLIQKGFNEFMSFSNRMEIENDLNPSKVLSDYNNKYFKFLSPENYIVSTYYFKFFSKLEVETDLLKEYEKYLKKYAVIIDYESLQMYWTRHGEAYMSLPSVLDNGGKLNFGKWLNLFLSTKEQ